MVFAPKVPMPPGCRGAIPFAGAIAVAGIIVSAAGCGSVQKAVDPPTAVTKTPGNYFAGAVAGGYSGVNGGNPGIFSDANYLATYSIDDSEHTFAEFTYSFTTGNQQGPQLNYSGTTASISGRLASAGIGYSNGTYGDAAGNIGAIGVTYSPVLGGNWILELGDHSGGLLNLTGMPFVPIVAPASCPGFTKPVAYHFISIPTYIGQTTGGGTIAPWFPQYDAAYGSVEVSTAQDKVKFGNIQQYNASGVQLSSYRDLPNSPRAITSTTGACSPTFFGDTVSVPGVLSITNPGVGQTVTPGAIVGIASSGLLLESNNSYGAEAANSNVSAPYQPFLGAGTGALGLPAPSGAMDAGSLTGAQYLGVIYGGGANAESWTSLIASFGFSSRPASCPIGTFQTPLYGGDFPGNNPTALASGGAGNCDVVIDLGAADSASNGLYPHATVNLYSGFEGNTTNLPHSLPAVAIAGELNGKFAIFILGTDTAGSPNQAWGIYLFQSN